MKKGFTMIEILAVFTLTAIIILITVPFIVNVLKGGDEMKYNQFIDTVTLAAESYVTDNNIELTGSTKILVSDLVEKKYLKSTVINPYNDTKISDAKNKNLKVKVTKDDENRLLYEIEGLN